MVFRDMAAVRQTFGTTEDIGQLTGQPEFIAAFVNRSVLQRAQKTKEPAKEFSSLAGS